MRISRWICFFAQVAYITHHTITIERTLMIYRQIFYVVLWLVAIVSANLLTTLSEWMSPVTSFVAIGLNLTVRDGLHEVWHNRGLWWKMTLLILAGSALSVAFNYDALQIAIASFLAFMGAGLADTVIYQLMYRFKRLEKVNASNLVSSLTDSLIFPIVAFGFPILWHIILADFAAKLAGGFIWSLILFWRPRQQVEAHG